MKLGTLFTVNAVLAIVFGLGFVLMPVALMSYYGVALADAGVSISQLLGAAFLAFGILSWQVRKSDTSEVLRAVVLSFFIGDAVGFLIVLQGQLSGEFNALGWSTVAIYGLLAIGFGYFNYQKKS